MHEPTLKITQEFRGRRKTTIFRTYQQTLNEKVFFRRVSCRPIPVFSAMIKTPTVSPTFADKEVKPFAGMLEKVCVCCVCFSTTSPKQCSWLNYLKCKKPKCLLFLFPSIKVVDSNRCYFAQNNFLFADDSSSLLVLDTSTTPQRIGIIHIIEQMLKFIIPKNYLHSLLKYLNKKWLNIKIPLHWLCPI